MYSRKLLLISLGVLLLASMILSACGPAPTSTDNVLAPIQYDSGPGVKIDYAMTVPEGDTDNKLYPSLHLAKDEVAICQTPGNEPQHVVVDGIGPHAYPDEYCQKIQSDIQTYVTMHDIAAECPNQIEEPLCRDEISRLALVNNATATMNVKIKFFHIVNSETAEMIYNLGYPGLMDEFNRIIKDGSRKFVFDKQLSVDKFDKYALAKEITDYVMSGAIFDDAPDSPYKELLKKSFQVVSFEVTYLEPDGLNTEAAAQSNQEIQEANSIATQWASACADYPAGSNQRLVCECNYSCTQSGQPCSCTSGINPAPIAVDPTSTPTVTP